MGILDLLRSGSVDITGNGLTEDVPVSGVGIATQEVRIIVTYLTNMNDATSELDRRIKESVDFTVLIEKNADLYPHIAQILKEHPLKYKATYSQSEHAEGWKIEIITDHILGVDEDGVNLDNRITIGQIVWIPEGHTLFVSNGQVLRRSDQGDKRFNKIEPKSNLN